MNIIGSYRNGALNRGLNVDHQMVNGKKMPYRGYAAPYVRY